jgi:predicted transcriptional regulator
MTLEDVPIEISSEERLLRAIFGEKAGQDLETYQLYMHDLPKREQELIDFYYYKKMNQKEIAKIIGVTQGAVSSRLSRAKKRLMYLRELKGIDFDVFYKDVEEVAESSLDMEIVKGIIKTSCQSETAQRINEKFCLVGSDRMTQVKVRYRFEKLMERLRVLGKRSYKYKRHYYTLKKIKDNLYRLHEVRLPHFDRRS